jgi:hypothetical protein
MARSRRGRQDKIKTDLKKVVMRDGIPLAQDREKWRALVTAVVNLPMEWNLSPS